MAKYQLIAGSFLVGSGKNRRKYNHAKPGQNIVESDENLAAKHPEKFKPVMYAEEGPYEFNPAANKKSDENRTTTNPGAQPPLTPTTAHRVDKKGKTIDEQYGGNLDDLSLADLKQVAEAEEIPLKGATKKEDIVKVLRAGKSN